VDLDLGGKSVIVTGGGSNIGRAICHRFAKEKARIVIAELDESQGNKIAEEIRDMGAEALFIRTDVTDNALVEKLAKELGRYGIRLNVVCPGLTVPESEAEISETSLWAGGMLDIYTKEIQAKAAKAYPLRKLGKAADIADAVCFLASDRAGNITGQTLSVSGGYTMM
jgi:NAD(P)-dependent dehydrogenase (short-subunit alcohol dehydrogenase family)